MMAAGDRTLLISVHGHFVIFSLPHPVQEGSDRAPLWGTWHPHHIYPGLSLCLHYSAWLNISSFCWRVHPFFLLKELVAICCSVYCWIFLTHLQMQRTVFSLCPGWKARYILLVVTEEVTSELSRAWIILCANNAERVRMISSCFTGSQPRWAFLGWSLSGWQSLVSELLCNSSIKQT